MTYEILNICGQGLFLKLDGFRLIYCCIALFMWSVSLLFSVEYFAHYNHKVRYYGFLLLTMFATLGVFLSADLFTMFVFFEVMSLSSYVWVAQEETEDALKAGVTYLAVAVIGGMVLLMGLFLFYDAAGTLRMDEIYPAVQSVWKEKSTRIYVSGFLMLVGFGAKAGMFPLHFWLPKAHPVAPAPASALLSGILTKCGVFGILILTAEVFVHDLLWGKVILLLGVITMVAGAVLAVFSVNLKRTLACSSVSQIGFILVGVGMQCFLGEENALAVRGTFLHMVNHSLIKLLLFNVAGVVYMNLHALDLNSIKGFGRKKPFLMGCFLMGALGIGGVPFWNGYVSKTLLHESIVEYIAHLEHLGESAVLFQSVEWLFLFSGGLTVAYMLKLFVCLFIEKHSEKQQAYEEKKAYMSGLSKVVIGAAALVLPVMGAVPSMTMDKMADAVMSFMRSGHLHHQVHYFTWVNLKGGLISIGIGVLVYTCFIRKVLIRKGSYVDLWPKKLDIEILFRKLVLGFTVLLGKVSKILDGFLMEWCTTEQLLKLLNDLVKVPDGFLVKWCTTEQVLKILNGCMKFPERLPEFFVSKLKQTVYKETTEPPELELVNKLHSQYDRKVDTLRLIGSSLSFGLLLACVGLILTIVYILIH